MYKEYSSSKVDDSEAIKKLASEIQGKEVLIMASGKTVADYAGEIEEYVERNKPLVISINFIPERVKKDYLFCANPIRWESISGAVDHSRCIVSSNVHMDVEGVYLVEYSRLIAEDSFLFDNSTIMLLNLLYLLLPSKITFAGFDGLNEKKDNYIKGAGPNIVSQVDYQEFNREISELLRKFKNKTQGKISFRFLTPSKYDAGEQAGHARM